MLKLNSVTFRYMWTLLGYFFTFFVYEHFGGIVVIPFFAFLAYMNYSVYSLRCPNCGTDIMRGASGLFRKQYARQLKILRSECPDCGGNITKAAVGS